ncbi:MAG: hypothetical protein ACAI35_23005 [Candidatus Methylacidiphilales bacterium]
MRNHIIELFPDPAEHSAILGKLAGEARRHNKAASESWEDIAARTVVQTMESFSPKGQRMDAPMDPGAGDASDTHQPNAAAGSKKKANSGQPASPFATFMESIKSELSAFPASQIPSIKNRLMKANFEYKGPMNSPEYVQHLRNAFNQIPRANLEAFENDIKAYPWKQQDAVRQALLEARRSFSGSDTAWEAHAREVLARHPVDQSLVPRQSLEAAMKECSDLIDSISGGERYTTGHAEMLIQQLTRRLKVPLNTILTAVNAVEEIPHLGETGAAKLPPASQPAARAGVIAKKKQVWEEAVSGCVESFLSFLPRRFLSGTHLPPFQVELVADFDPKRSSAWYNQPKDGKNDIITINTIKDKYQWRFYEKVYNVKRSEAMEDVRRAILRSVYHEGMHWLHTNADPGYQKLIQEHFESRTEGVEAEDLPGDMNGKQYKKDHFFRDYLGVVQKGSIPGHEIPTCVGELLADPIELAKQLRKPEHRDTIIRVFSILFQ